jgi:hypothetical protein
MATSDTNHPKRSLEDAFDHYLADLPWGVFVFILLAIGGFVCTVLGHLDVGTYMGALASGSGLLAVGHGIRTRGRGR